MVSMEASDGVARGCGDNNMEHCAYHNPGPVELEYGPQISGNYFQHNQESTPPPRCGYTFKPGEDVYHCRDCSFNEMVVLCMWPWTPNQRMDGVIRAIQRVTLLVIVATRACSRPYSTVTTTFHQSFVRCPTCTTATISFKNTTSCSTAELATVPRAILGKKHRMESRHGFAGDASILTSMWSIRSNRVSAVTKDTIVTVEIKPF
ncbi:hypothetical protein CPB97_001152 [Podila verticillata]|nr:hypothetical protein CPB97_001152 [Podila verticillata]